MGFGAKVGVGVAVPAVIIILSSIFAFVCARRRRRQKMYGATATTGPGEENRDPASGHEVWGKPELQGDIDEQKGGGAIYQKAELQGVPGGPPPVLPPGAVVQDQRETTVPATETQYAVPEMAAAYHGNRPELHDQGATIVEAGGNQAREHPPELHSQHSHIMELSSERGETERVQLSSGDEGWRPHQSEFSQNPPWTQTWPVEYGTPNAQAAQSVQPVQPTTDDTQMNAARLAELEAKKADVDEKLNRARQMEALEEEQARIQAEIEALKNKG
jgi:hypothetical protein